MELCVISGAGSRLKSRAAITRNLNARETRRLLLLMPVLAMISCSPPASIYDLARKLKADVSNLRKDLTFLRKLEIIHLPEGKRGGRLVKVPRALTHRISVRFEESKRLPTRTGRVLRRRRMIG